MMELHPLFSEVPSSASPVGSLDGRRQEDPCAQCRHPAHRDGCKVCDYLLYWTSPCGHWMREVGGNRADRMFDGRPETRDGTAAILPTV